jgi:hypothetical protein
MTPLLLVSVIAAAGASVGLIDSRDSQGTQKSKAP